MDSKDSDQSPRWCNSCKTLKDLNGDNFEMAENGFSLTCLICLTARRKRFALKKKDKTWQSIASGVSGDLSDSNIDEEDEDEGKFFLSCLNLALMHFWELFLILEGMFPLSWLV